jgi:hypothetical protein
MLASGGADEDVTWLEGAAAIAASVAVKSSGTAAVCADAGLFAMTGGATASLSRECRQEHPETVTDRARRPAAMRNPKISFETMLHSEHTRELNRLVSLVVILAQGWAAHDLMSTLCARSRELPTSLKKATPANLESV